MATSGSFNTTSCDGRYLTFSWSLSSQSIANNTSTISWSLQGAGVSGYVMCGGFTVVIDGETVYSTSTDDRIEVRTTTTVASGTKTITHNSSGAKNFSASVSAAIYTYAVNCSGSSSWDLTSIPRQATLSTATNFNDTENPTITYSNPAGTAVTLAAAIYNSSGSASYVGYKDLNESASSFTFSLTDAERTNLRSAASSSNSLAVRFYLRTTIGSTNYYSYLDRTMTITGANPVVSGSVVDTNETTIALTGDSSKLIKYCSTAEATMTATAQKGASISSYSIKNGSSSSSSTSLTIYSVENNTFTFSATDSRGNTGSKTVTPTMVDYVKLSCNIANNKPDADGDMTVACSGNYFNGSFGAVSNTLSVQYRYKTSGGTYSAWTDMTVTKSGNWYSATASLSGLDYQTSYVFQTRAIDALTTINSAEPTVRSTPVFHWGENDFVFEVPVTFNGGGGFEYGTWTPTLVASVVSSYTTQQGWYQKVGNCVTIGFYIKATCSSGYDSTSISITGLPFTPMWQASGGGICSGAYVSAGYVFEGFVAETSGSITTRVQKYSSRAANLSTSASGCFYRSGGGEITLSGTITYYTSV